MTTSHEVALLLTFGLLIGLLGAVILGAWFTC